MSHTDQLSAEEDQSISTFTTLSTIQYKNGYFQGFIDEFNHRHGRGTYVWHTGEIYFGDWAQDCMEGEGIFYFALGGYVFGTFLNNKVHGYAVLHFFDGDYIAGFWDKGILTGKVVQHSKASNDWRLYEYKDGSPNRTLMKGKGDPPIQRFTMLETCFLKKLLDRQVDIFAAGQNNKPNEKSLDFLAIDSDGWYHGNIKSKVPNGLGIICYTEHRNDRGRFKKGSLDGPGRSLFPNGDVYDGFYKDGKFDGMGIYFKNETEQYLYGTYENNECVQPITLGDGYPHELIRSLKADFNIEGTEYVDKETETEVVTLSYNDQMETRSSEKSEADHFKVSLKQSKVVQKAQEKVEEEEDEKEERKGKQEKQEKEEREEEEEEIEHKAEQNEKESFLQGMDHFVDGDSSQFTDEHNQTAELGKIELTQEDHGFIPSKQNRVNTDRNQQGNYYEESPKPKGKLTNEKEIIHWEEEEYEQSSDTKSRAEEKSISFEKQTSIVKHSSKDSENREDDIPSKKSIPISEVLEKKSPSKGNLDSFHRLSDKDSLQNNLNTRGSEDEPEVIYKEQSPLEKKEELVGSNGSLDSQKKSKVKDEKAIKSEQKIEKWPNISNNKGWLDPKKEENLTKRVSTQNNESQPTEADSENPFSYRSSEFIQKALSVRPPQRSVSRPIPRDPNFGRLPTDSHGIVTPYKTKSVDTMQTTRQDSSESPEKGKFEVTNDRDRSVGTLSPNDESQTLSGKHWSPQKKLPTHISCEVKKIMNEIFNKNSTIRKLTPDPKLRTESSNSSLFRTPEKKNDLIFSKPINASPSFDNSVQGSGSKYNQIQPIEMSPPMTQRVSNIPSLEGSVVLQDRGRDVQKVFKGESFGAISNSLSEHSSLPKEPLQANSGFGQNQYTSGSFYSSKDQPAKFGLSSTESETFYKQNTSSLDKQAQIQKIKEEYLPSRFKSKEAALPEKDHKSYLTSSPFSLPKDGKGNELAVLNRSQIKENPVVNAEKINGSILSTFNPTTSGLNYNFGEKSLNTSVPLGTSVRNLQGPSLGNTSLRESKLNGDMISSIANKSEKASLPSTSDILKRYGLDKPENDIKTKSDSSFKTVSSGNKEQDFVQNPAEKEPTKQKLQEELYKIILLKLEILIKEQNKTSGVVEELKRMFNEKLDLFVKDERKDRESFKSNLEKNVDLLLKEKTKNMSLEEIAKMYIGFGRHGVQTNFLPGKTDTNLNFSQKPVPQGFDQSINRDFKNNAIDFKKPYTNFSDISYAKPGNVTGNVSMNLKPDTQNRTYTEPAKTLEKINIPTYKEVPRQKEPLRSSAELREGSYAKSFLNKVSKEETNTNDEINPPKVQRDYITKKSSIQTKTFTEPSQSEEQIHDDLTNYESVDSDTAPAKSVNSMQLKARQFSSKNEHILNLLEYEPKPINPKVESRSEAKNALKTEADIITTPTRQPTNFQRSFTPTPETRGLFNSSNRDSGYRRSPSPIFTRKASMSPDPLLGSNNKYVNDIMKTPSNVQRGNPLNRAYTSPIAEQKEIDSSSNRSFYRASTVADPTMHNEHHKIIDNHQWRPEYAQSGHTKIQNPSSPYQAKNPDLRAHQRAYSTYSPIPLTNNWKNDRPTPPEAERRLPTSPCREEYVKVDKGSAVHRNMGFIRKDISANHPLKMTSSKKNYSDKKNEAQEIDLYEDDNSYYIKQNNQGAFGPRDVSRRINTENLSGTYGANLFTDSQRYPLRTEKSELSPLKDPKVFKQEGKFGTMRWKFELEDSQDEDAAGSINSERNYNNSSAKQKPKGRIREMTEYYQQGNDNSRGDIQTPNSIRILENVNEFKRGTPGKEFMNGRQEEVQPDSNRRVYKLSDKAKQNYVVDTKKPSLTLTSEILAKRGDDQNSHNYFNGSQSGRKPVPYDESNIISSDRDYYGGENQLNSKRGIYRPSFK